MSHAVVIADRRVLATGHAGRAVHRPFPESTPIADLDGRHPPFRQPFR